MKYYITTFTLTAEAAKEMVAAAADVLKALLCDAGYEAFEDIDDLRKLDDTATFDDLTALNMVKTIKSGDNLNSLQLSNATAFQAYIQQSIYPKECVEEAIAQMPFSDIHINYITREAEDKNWNEAWEKTQEPSEICQRLGISIDVKQAFGTGNHDTTHMMLTRLTEIDIAGKSVLDCGCGSGILSIAALKMGAASAVAYDIDEWSVENTKHNASLNDTKVTVMLGDSSCLNDVKDTFDIVLANINRNILLHDLPAFANHLKAEGKLLLSGFYEEDTPLLLDKAATLGLELTYEKTSSKWKLLELAKHIVREKQSR